MTRAHRSFWALTTTTVLSAGLVAQTLAARASPPADILLAAGTLLLAASSTLLIRVMSRLIPHNTPATGSTAANASPEPINRAG
jgi:hypothetical protein